MSVQDYDQRNIQYIYIKLSENKFSRPNIMIMADNLVLVLGSWLVISCLILKVVNVNGKCNEQ